jgi:hypothetical protein
MGRNCPRLLTGLAEAPPGSRKGLLRKYREVAGPGTGRRSTSQ